MALGIIGGTSLMELSQFVEQGREKVSTPFGDPSAEIIKGHFVGNTTPTFFLPRHGLPHSIAPHLINYRANIWALKHLGVQQIVAVNAVGGIHPNMQTHALVVPDQLIDYTYGRDLSFFDGVHQPLEHIDFTNPFSEVVRQKVINAAQVQNFQVLNHATLAVTQGPRLETAAEIQRLKNDGCDLVGMTSMPEASLARELEIDYACIALVVNPAAGLSDEVITLDEIKRVVEAGTQKIAKLLLSLNVAG